MWKSKTRKVIDSLVHVSLGQRLNHPNLLNIRHLGAGNTPYIVMELMDGGDVAELLAEGVGTCISSGTICIA